jgi:hypothetical protein
MSAIGSVIIATISPVYQLAFLTPGITPRSARFLKQIRQIPNFRYTARGRPHNLQRLSEREENFGGLSAFAIFDLLAMSCYYAV